MVRWRHCRYLASTLTGTATVLLLPGSEIVDQLAWLVVAAIVTFGTGVLTAGRRRAEEKLIALATGEREQRLSAESLSELKTELLAQVAHELRQPMSAISVAAGLLEAPSESARERAVSVIVRQSAQLRELIDDLLDLSRLSRDDLQLRKAEIDICELVDDSVQVIAGDVAARRLGLSSSLPDCPVHLVADPTRVRQILTNLLSNAVKFTPEGGKIDRAGRRSRHRPRRGERSYRAAWRIGRSPELRSKARQRIHRSTSACDRSLRLVTADLRHTHPHPDQVA